jgi:hypothetical protein
MDAVSAGGRALRKGKWRGASLPCVDIEPYDPAYFKLMLARVVAEFGVAMPEIDEDEERGGLSTDFVIEGRRAGAFMNGRRCSIAVDSEALRDRVFELLLETVE